VLAGAELDAAAAAIAGQRQHRPAAEPAAVSAAVPAAVPAARRANAFDRMLATMDSDGDDRLSREEWNGEDAGWDRLDTNGDGFVTADEAG